MFLQASRLKKDLLACAEERDGAQLERDLLSSRLKHLESELESERSSHTDRGREIRALEVRARRGRKVPVENEVSLGQWYERTSRKYRIPHFLFCVSGQSEDDGD